MGMRVLVLCRSLVMTMITPSADLEPGEKERRREKEKRRLEKRENIKLNVDNLTGIDLHIEYEPNSRTRKSYAYICVRTYLYLLTYLLVQALMK